MLISHVSVPQKKVGFWLGVGIVCLPFIFGWFTLRKGYSIITRIISFSWLLLFLLVGGFSDSSTKTEGKIKDGMSYSQVRDIMGFDGTETSRTEANGIKTVYYFWNNKDGGVHTTFQNDRLVTVVFSNKKNLNYITDSQDKSISEPTNRQENLEIIESHPFNDGSVRYVVGTVKNNSNKQYRYVQVEINLYDKSGAQVGSTMSNVNNLEAHGTWKFKAIILEDNAKKFLVKGVTGF